MCEYNQTVCLLSRRPRPHCLRNYLLSCNVLDYFKHGCMKLRYNHRLLCHIISLPTVTLKQSSNVYDAQYNSDLYYIILQQ